MPVAILLLALIICSPLARAEYRVFRLAIVDEKSKAKREVVTTLDNVQYPGYYHVRPTELVEITETWMCWERSDHSQDPAQTYCASPNETSRRPASTSP